MTLAIYKTPAEIDADAYPSVVAIFEDAVRKYATTTAYRCFGKDMTYAEIEAKSRAVAAWLQKKHGVVAGDRVALMCPNTFAFPIAMLGILRAGAAQVNVNPLYTGPELEHQLKDSGAETIFIFGGSTKVLADIIAETPVKTVVTIDLGDGSGIDMLSPPVDPRLTCTHRLADVMAEGARLSFDPLTLTGEDILFFQYTGGTTGASKAAVLTHRNLVANIEQYKAHYAGAVEEGAETAVVALPLYHIFGLMLSLAYMSVGGTVLLIPNPRDMDSFVAALKASPPTFIPGVNTLFAGLAAHPKIREVDFSRLKAAVGGGAPVLKATSAKWKALTGNHVKVGYGLSETSPVLTITELDETEFTGGAGFGTPSTEMVLLGDDDRPVEAGEAGEICVRGPQVMRGYWNKPEANRDAFTPDGFFRTGDIGVLDPEAGLMIVDRKKDMVIVSGFNVYPADVEAAVSHCPGVHECACIGVPDERTGEAVRVYVVPEAGTTLTADEVMAFCRNSLTGYKIPHQIVFVPELPKSNVGKILRRELRRLVKEGAL